MIACTESIWEELNKPLKSFIQRRINNEQDVDDILQSVFCKIHSSIGSLKDTEKIHGKGLLKRIYANRFYLIIYIAKPIEKFDLTLYYKLVEKVTVQDKWMLVVTLH